MKKKKLAADSKVDVMMFEPHNMKVSGGKKKNKKSRDEKRTKSKVGRMEVEEFDTFHVDKVGLAEGKLQRKKKGKNIENIDKADECNGKDGASEKQHGKPKKAAKMKKKKQLVANDNYSDIFMEKKGEENEGDDAEDEVYKMSSGDEDYSKEGNSYRGSKEEKEDKMNKKLAADSKVDAKMFGPHNMKAYETLEVSGGKNKRKKSSDKKRTKSRVARMGVEEFKSCHMDKVEQAEGKLQKLRKKIRKNVQNIDKVEECNGKDGASEQQNDSKPEDHITNSGLLNNCTLLPRTQNTHWQMATPLSVRPNRAITGSDRLRSTSSHWSGRWPIVNVLNSGRRRPWGALFSRRILATPPQAGSRADDSAPFEMSMESALKVLGVSEGASFDDILRAKNSIIASCEDDQQAISQVEAAYDMLLMQSLSQRRAGKVVHSSIRFADVNPVNAPNTGSMSKWLQTYAKNSPVSVEAPSTRELGVQAGVYGALMVLTYVNGASAPSTGSYGDTDVPGLILATSFGASLYFMTKKNVKLGKATVITIGGLVAGAVVGSAVESWLQVDIVPFMGIHTPATVVSEFVLFSQFLVSLYLR